MCERVSDSFFQAPKDELPDQSVYASNIPETGTLD